MTASGRSIYSRNSLYLLLAACSGSIYTGLPEELKTTEAPLFYVTDKRLKELPLVDLGHKFWRVPPGYPKKN